VLRSNRINCHARRRSGRASRSGRVHGDEYAVGLASGITALHAALVSVGLEPGDEVIAPALTSLASAAAIVPETAPTPTTCTAL
jgi:dTDP-4-amino-4,6-dideoxygalactose transaminase